MLAILAGAFEDGMIDAGLIQDVFGLSNREAGIARFRASGQTPGQIAVSSDRSEKVVRNQIQVIFVKVGVNSARAPADALAVFRAASTMLDGPDPRYLDGRRLSDL